MTSDDFRAALARLFGDAAEAGRDTIVVRAGHLHRIVRGYPGPDHRMPVCCDVMYARSRKVREVAAFVRQNQPRLGR